MSQRYREQYLQRRSCFPSPFPIRISLVYPIPPPTATPSAAATQPLGIASLSFRFLNQSFALPRRPSANGRVTQATVRWVMRLRRSRWIPIIFAKLATALTARGATTDAFQMTVLKYESDLKWSSKSLTVDDVLDELSLVAIVQ